MGTRPTKIRITSSPEIEAPKEVRDAWIGCEFEGTPYQGDHRPGVLTSEAPKIDGYEVDQFTALTVLATRDRPALSW